MGADDRAILPGEFGEGALELRMDRALAAVHHDSDVEQLVELVEDHVVLIVERVRGQRIGPEIAVGIVPVEAGAADRHHGGAVALLVVGIGGFLQQSEMAADAVVVIEKAVADEDFALWKIRPERRDLWPRLCRCQTGRQADGRRRH